MPIGAFGVVAVAPGLWTGSLSGPAFGAAIAALGLSMFALVRPLFIRAQLTADGLRVISWFTTRTIRWSDVSRVDSAAYAGWMTVYRESSLARMLGVRLTGGRWVWFPALIASRSAAREQVEQIRSAMAEPGETGHQPSEA